MKTLGLTGGVGMGKTASATHLRARGLPVLDTDALARQLVEPGQPALAEVREAFGPEVVGSDGRLRRDELARRVFPDAPARRRLEGILHPRIRQLWRSQLALWRADGRPLAVVIIPLLFETGADSELDAAICVACSPETQHQRLLARGWSPAHIAERLAAQWPIENKIARSDFLVWTDTSLNVHQEQLDRILQQLDSTS